MTAGDRRGSCHCGRIRLTLAAQPREMTDCDCSLCTKAGVVWGYLPASEVTIEGGYRRYRRDDHPDPWIAVGFCGHCGATTHWELLPEHAGEDRMAVNMNLFPDTLRVGMTLRFEEGRDHVPGTAWTDRRPPIVWTRDMRR